MRAISGRFEEGPASPNLSAPILTASLSFRSPIASESVDPEAPIKPEESEDCNIPHTHSHDHDETGDHRKPHKPKKEHQVDLHDVTGHSHDVVSGVLDDGHDHDADLATIFLELGMYVPFSPFPPLVGGCLAPFQHDLGAFEDLPSPRDRLDRLGGDSESPEHVPMESHSCEMLIQANPNPLSFQSLPLGYHRSRSWSCH